MSVKIEWTEEGGLRFVGSDVFDGDEVIKLNAELYSSDEDTQRIRYQIIDLREVMEFRLTSYHMRILAQQDSRAAEINPNMVIAVVSPKPGTYGMNRMYQAFFEGNEDNLCVFSDMKEAVAWVNERMKKIH